MARGGYGQGSGLPLHARSRARSPVAAPAPGPAAAASGVRREEADGPARHCWVSLPVDGTRARPALLLEWRKGEKGRWEGRVVYAAQLRAGAWSSVEEWVPAELLTVAE